MAHQAVHNMMLSLPTDVISCIVRCLQQDAGQGSLADVAALRGVCRSLRAAVDASVTHAAFHPNVGAAELRSITRRCTGLHAVKLQHLHPEAAGPSLEALVAMPHLRALDLPMVPDIQLEDWMRLSSLTGLTLRQVNAYDRETLAVVLPRLTALQSLVLANDEASRLLNGDVERLTTLSRLTHLGLGCVTGLAPMAPQLLNLRSLELRLRKRVQTLAWRGKSFVWEEPWLNDLTRLERLTLAAFADDDRLLSLRLGANVMVSFCNTPEADNFSGDALQRAHVQPLQGIRQLTALELRTWLPPDWSRCAPGGLPLAALPPYDTLRELRLMECEVEADVAANLGTVARQLHMLHLPGCDGAVAQLLRAAVVVEDVSLRGAQGGGELLAALGPAAGTLRALDATLLLRDTSDPDSEHLAALTGLTRLAYGNNGDELDPIGAIAQLTRLRGLLLRCSPALSDAQLMSLSTLQSLTSLELAGRNQATGEWLASLASAHVLLRELRLWNAAVVPGCGAEAAIGRLTRLTSLHLSIDRTAIQPNGSVLPEEMPHSTHRLTRGQLEMAGVPLQLQLLGCFGAARAAGGGRPTGRNTGLQELLLECAGPLSDDELAAAAGGLPDLRRLEVSGSDLAPNPLVGLSGARLAAFSACRRLRDIWLLGPNPHLDRRHLVAQLPHIASLASLRVLKWPRVGDLNVAELQAAFRAEHGRHLAVQLQHPY